MPKHLLPAIVTIEYYRIIKEYSVQTKQGKTIALCWIPSHVGIPGNEKTADSDRGLERGSSCNSSSVDLLPGSALMPCNHRDRLCFAHLLRAEWPIRVSTYTALHFCARPTLNVQAISGSLNAAESPGK